MRLLHLAFALALLMQSLAFAGQRPANVSMTLGATQAADCRGREDGAPAPRAHSHPCFLCSLHDFNNSVGAPPPGLLVRPPRVSASASREAPRVRDSFEEASSHRARAPPEPA